jgi:hypothetical protein
MYIDATGISTMAGDWVNVTVTTDTVAVITGEGAIIVEDGPFDTVDTEGVAVTGTAIKASTGVIVIADIIIADVVTEEDTNIAVPTDATIADVSVIVTGIAIEANTGVIVIADIIIADVVTKEDISIADTIDTTTVQDITMVQGHTADVIGTALTAITGAEGIVLIATEDTAVFGSKVDFTADVIVAGNSTIK